jgi:hypothetical protein
MIFMSLSSGKIVHIRDILICVVAEFWIDLAVDEQVEGSCGHCNA